MDLLVDGVTVNQVRVFKYLGVLINDTLTNVDMICRKVSCHLNLLRRLSWFLPRSLLLSYLKSYILPTLTIVMTSGLAVLKMNLAAWNRC